MIVYTCKMCGAPLNITEGMTVCECEYCGTSQTLAKIGDEKRIAAVNRANHFRQSGDFDRAEQAYEELITQGGSDGNVDDADLYWSLTLCRYGIEYVTDPTTGRKVPTCHRLQYKNILDDDDYRRAVSCADLSQKRVLLSEACYISDVQKRILEISKQEDPYDVFICYKENNEQGARTKDSVLAQDMYYQLLREGFKVFFARVTLEGKLGAEYEPYIFAALHSAKTMIVVGTKKEFFEAPWVKNEWMRYLAIMKEDRSRRLIPAYLGMDPYDLPDALATFQAQDMSKLGFMQDMLTNIGRRDQKERDKTAAKRETLVVADMTETAPLLRRIGYFLEDGEFDRAAQYCDRVLNIEPECAQAYAYKLMIEKKAHTLEELGQVLDHDGITADDSYKKAVRFADPELKETLKRLDQQMIYNDAITKMQKEDDLEAIREAIHELGVIAGFKDADQKHSEAIDIFTQTSEKLFHTLNREMEDLEGKTDHSAMERYSQLAERFVKFQKVRVLDEMGAAEKEEFMKRAFLCEEDAKACRFQAAVIKVSEAETQKSQTPYDRLQAAKEMRKFGDYRDAAERAAACEKIAHEELYDHAKNAMKKARRPEDYYGVAKLFEEIMGYADSRRMVEKCRNKAVTKEFVHTFYPFVLIIIAGLGEILSYVYLHGQPENNTLYTVLASIFAIPLLIGGIVVAIRLAIWLEQFSDM
ncbi:MAG: TIR domain-containing protein [Lachnospiraceae bacterium]|nr:TIR domain-containing protein [Lachnospiraceae bacterium]